MHESFKRDLKAFAETTLGCAHVGITSAERPWDYHRYLEWIKNGFAADMKYMSDPVKVQKRADMSQLLPGAKSAIVLAFPYAYSARPLSDAHFARYGWGEDYHGVLGKKLARLVQWMKEHALEDFSAKYFVDTGPILERSLAARAGLGWIGKNTCLINERSGSYLFLSEVITTLELPLDAPMGIDRCGSCTRCLDACPTHALRAPYQLDSRKCISYQTIENKSLHIPKDIQDRLEGWVAGCDICQEVCPWNHDLHHDVPPEFKPAEPIGMQRSQLNSLSEAQYDAMFKFSAFSRITFKKFKSTLILGGFPSPER